MKSIPLTRGKFAVIDDEDFEEISKHKWCCNSDGYACKAKRVVGGGKTGYIMMHRIINKTPDGLLTDHIDGNKLNNCRHNLRSCTKAENLRNRPILKNNSTGLKGVYYKKRNRGFVAQITVDNKRLYLGIFKTSIEAKAVYDDAAIKYHGEFACL